MVYDQIIILGTPIVRSLAGWIQKALEDGKIDSYEWKQLLSTFLRMTIPAVALFYGLSLPVEVSAAIPLLAEYVYDLFKKVKKA